MITLLRSSWTDRPIASTPLLAFEFVLFAAAALSAQQPAFEVATVKPSTPQEREIAIRTYPGGRISITNYPLHDMLWEAFHVHPFQVIGGPRWITEDRYSVEAKPPADSKSAKFMPAYPKVPPTDEQRRMLQTLLIEQFHLKLHRETREGPIYFLTRGAKELKLQPSKDPDEYPWAGGLHGGGFSGDGLRGMNITMAQLAERLGRELGRNVIDQTAISGAYDFRIEYAGEGDRSDTAASIFASLQGLGLKLESGKGPVEYIVIDSAEKIRQ